MVIVKSRYVLKQDAEASVVCCVPILLCDVGRRPKSAGVFPDLSRTNRKCPDTTFLHHHHASLLKSSIKQVDTTLQLHQGRFFDNSNLPDIPQPAPHYQNMGFQFSANIRDMGPEAAMLWTTPEAVILEFHFAEEGELPVGTNFGLHGFHD